MIWVCIEKKIIFESSNSLSPNVLYHYSIPNGPAVENSKISCTMAIKENWYNADCEYNFFSIQTLSFQVFDRVCRMHENFFSSLWQLLWGWHFRGQSIWKKWTYTKYIAPFRQGDNGTKIQFFSLIIANGHQLSAEQFGKISTMVI